MFPIVLTPKYTNILLIGDGELADKREEQLIEANFSLNRFKADPPTEHELKSAHIVYIVDYPEEQAIKIADLCRSFGTLVNIEDDLPYCDFHTPALVRRGDLLISISTNGKSPRLAQRIKKRLSLMFPEEWAEKLDRLGKIRLEWRSQGMSLKQVAQKTDEFLEQEGWLEDDYNQKQHRTE